VAGHWPTFFEALGTKKKKKKKKERKEKTTLSPPKFLQVITFEECLMCF
jgi:hypothetical protein